MKSIPQAARGISIIVSFALLGTAHAALDGYWPINETTGTVVDNTVLSGTDANCAARQT